MFNIRDLLEPVTLDEALTYLNINNNLTIISGGTDVLIKLRHNKYSNCELLSLRKIHELSNIKVLDNGTILIGACCTFNDIYRNIHINNNIPILCEAAISMGGPQIRSMATIGGNICNGAVSADSAPALFCLNAKLKIKSLNSQRIIPIKDFYKGPGKVDISADEILTEIIIDGPDYKNYQGKYIKFCNRKAMDISMLGVAVLCKVSNEYLEDIRICLGVAAPTPIRCIQAEEFAKKKQICLNTIKDISNLAKLSSKARNSWRGSKDFREHLIVNLTELALLDVIKKSGVKIDE